MKININLIAFTKNQSNLSMKRTISVQRGTRGPKGRFEDSMIEEVFKLARFGMTNAEMAAFYEISDSTFLNYQRKYPEFNEAMQRGRVMDSLKVVASLHKQALGYTVTETEDAEHMTRSGERVTLHKTINTHIQPNVTAAIYLLKTRHGDKWMDIIKTESTKNVIFNIKQTDPEGFTVDELKYLERIGMKRLAEANAEDVHSN